MINGHIGMTCSFPAISAEWSGQHILDHRSSSSVGAQTCCLNQQDIWGFEMIQETNMVI